MKFLVSNKVLESPKENTLSVFFRFGSNKNTEKMNAKWIVHIRKNEEFAVFRHIGMQLCDVSSRTIYVHMQDIPLKWKAMAMYLLTKYVYHFDKYKGKKESLQQMVFYEASETVQVRDLLHKVLVTYHVRDMINEPANVFTPSAFCQHVKGMFRDEAVKVSWFTDKEIQEKGLRLVNAVGKASKNKPRFLIMDYKPAKYTQTFCMVGKGVTFDAGGLQLKPRGSNTYEMKGDKTGGCIVVGLLQYFAAVKAPCRIVGLVPLVENIISDDVTHPGDIVKSYSGKTVEILDTDAEGRLILADGLAYAAKNYAPDYIFDFATLTGWADNLHCDTSSIYLAPGKELFDMVEEIGNRVGERVWGLPRWMDLRSHCTSSIADLKNHELTVYGCKNGSGFMASMFLSHFVPDHLLSKWIHFDITNNEHQHVMNANSLYLAMHLIHALIIKGK